MDAPQLTTQRLRLRPMRADDAGPLHEMFGDPRVMAAFGLPPFDPRDTEAWVKRNLEHQDVHGYGLFTVIELPTGTVVGDCGLTHLESGDVELGYDLRADRWGRGIATEAAIAVRDFAFGSLGLERLVSLIQLGNVRSERVAMRVGMHRETELVSDGRRYSRYAMSSSDWAE